MIQCCAVLAAESQVELEINKRSQKGSCTRVVSMFATLTQEECSFDLIASRAEEEHCIASTRKF